MKELVFLLEEASAKAMLEGVLPRLLDASIRPRLIPFEGKQDLEKHVIRRIRGYQNRAARFIVLRDQDSAPDCRMVKSHLLNLCDKTGRAAVTLVRIACRELESFYLADLSAVEQGLGLSKLMKLQAQAKFRAPDYLGSPSKELFVLTQGSYQKISGSRAIGKYLDLTNQRSVSFKNLLQGIQRMERELLALT